RFGRSDESVVFGHEFCGEVAEHGARCRRTVPTGTPVVALPLLRGSAGVDTIGLSAHAPGAYAEQMLVEEALMMPVPDGLALELAVGTREKLERLPIGWWHVWRLGEALGAAPKHPVIFECVGVPGVLDSIIEGAPLFSRIVVAGVCVGPDRITPAMAINKEVDVRFVFGYTPLEFRDTLHMLAAGKVDPEPPITGTVGLDGVGAAFDALADPEAHAKILIDPRSEDTEPRAPAG